MQEAITSILSGISSLMTTLFNVSQAEGADNTLAYVALLPIVGGIVARGVSVVRAGRG